jgi:hypothetical protein
MMAGGTVRSFLPEISSNGPRVALAVSIFAGECRERFAVAAFNNGRPGDGVVHC